MGQLAKERAQRKAETQRAERASRPSASTVQQGGRFASASDNIKNKANTARLQGESTFEVINSQGDIVRGKTAEFAKQQNIQRQQRQREEQQKQEQQKQEQQKIQRQESAKIATVRQSVQKSSFDAVATPGTSFGIEPPFAAYADDTQQPQQERYSVETPNGKVRTFDTREKAQKFIDRMESSQLKRSPAEFGPYIETQKDAETIIRNRQEFQDDEDRKKLKTLSDNAIVKNVKILQPLAKQFDETFELGKLPKERSAKPRAIPGIDPDVFSLPSNQLLTGYAAPVSNLLADVDDLGIAISKEIRGEKGFEPSKGGMFGIGKGLPVPKPVNYKIETASSRALSGKPINFTDPLQRGSIYGDVTILGAAVVTGLGPKPKTARSFGAPVKTAPVKVSPPYKTGIKASLNRLIYGEKSRIKLSESGTYAGEIPAVPGLGKRIKSAPSKIKSGIQSKKSLLDPDTGLYKTPVKEIRKNLSYYEARVKSQVITRSKVAAKRKFDISRERLFEKSYQFDTRSVQSKNRAKFGKTPVSLGVGLGATIPKGKTKPDVPPKQSGSFDIVGLGKKGGTISKPFFKEPKTPTKGNQMLKDAAKAEKQIQKTTEKSYQQKQAKRQSNTLDNLFKKPATKKGKYQGQSYEQSYEYSIKNKPSSKKPGLVIAVPTFAPAVAAGLLVSAKPAKEPQWEIVKPRQDTKQRSRERIGIVTIPGQKQTPKQAAKQAIRQAYGIVPDYAPGPVETNEPAFVPLPIRRSSSGSQPPIVPPFAPSRIPAARFASYGYDDRNSLTKMYAAYGISSDINIKTLPTYSRVSRGRGIFAQQEKEDKRIQELFYGKSRKPKPRKSTSKGKSRKGKK